MAIEVLDLGGGFPVAYPDIDPPPLGALLAEIEATFERLDLPGVRLWAEPGRALVAGGASVVVQVQLRRGDTLFVNDGVYGSPSDAGAPGFRFPARLIRPEAPAASDVLRGFELFGPTCDSADRMRGRSCCRRMCARGTGSNWGSLGLTGRACERRSTGSIGRGW